MTAVCDSDSDLSLLVILKSVDLKINPTFLKNLNFEALSELVSEPRRQPLAWQLTRSVTVPTRGTGRGR